MDHNPCQHPADIRDVGARPVPVAAATARTRPAAGRRLLSIVHVVDSLELGGLERVITDLAIEQAAHGHRVAVFSIAGAGFLKADLDAAGIPVVIGGKRRTFDTTVLRALRRTVIDIDADVVHSHNFVPSYHAAAALLWPLAGKPVLVNTCHNMGTRLSRTRLRWLYRLSLLRTARVAMVGRQVHQRLVGSGIVDVGQATTLLNGIPVERHAGSADTRMTARAKLGLPPDADVIGTVGRLVPLKNHRALIATMPTLLASHPALHLVLLGDGPLRDELRDLAGSLGLGGRVHLPGASDDVAGLLPAFDIFALPSLTEGLSIALLEACAAGLAIVATAVGGNPEIIADGDTGRLVPSEDIEALRDALGELLDDPALRQRLGTAARDWVRMYGSIQAMRRAHEAFYADALAIR